MEDEIKYVDREDLRVSQIGKKYGKYYVRLAILPVSVVKERIDRYLQMLENRHYNILEHKLQHDLEELDSKVRK